MCGLGKAYARVQRVSLNYNFHSRCAQEKEIRIAPVVVLDVA